MKKTWKIDIDCPNCAAKVERALQKLPGVVSVSLNYVQKKITLEAPADRFEEVRKAAYAKMKEIEPDAEIFFDEAEQPSGTSCPCGGHHHEDDDDDEHEHHHHHDGKCGCGHEHHPHDDDDDDDDEDGSEATLSEQNLYRRLSEYYDLLEDLDNYVRGCAQNFNGSYLEEDRTTRQNLADVAERTEDTIEQYYDIVEDLDVPTSSKNYSSWKDIIALYDDLDHRIDAICDAWEISLKYAKPADHKNEIVAPLSRDNVAGTNDNKYRLDFEERYPGAKPVEVN